MTKQLSLAGNIKIDEDSTNVCTKALSIVESYDEIVNHGIIISAGASDQAINFGGIVSDASLLFLVPEYDANAAAEDYVTVKVNGAAAGIPVGKFLALSGNGTNGIDSLTVSNPDATYQVFMDIYICK